MIKLTIVLFTFFMAFSTVAQKMYEGFTGDHIGNPKVQGNHQYDEKTQSFTLTGAGYNIWFDRDEFYYVSKAVKGDFILTARVEFTGKGVNAHRKAGLMIRTSKEDNAVYMDAALHGDGLTAMQYREIHGGTTLEKRALKVMPDVLQLERIGNICIMRIAKDGSPLEVVSSLAVPLDSTVFAGMFVCSHETEVTETVVFSNVRLEIPAPEGTDGYRAPSPGRLEILDVSTGLREVIYETDDHIEAPNWSTDGKYLIYNVAGRLYKFDLTKRVPEEIFTGEVVSNNNDHGISFDGKTLAISSAKEINGKKVSVIWTVPVSGGIPQQITPSGPSYWHGWSPDGKWLTYCAERNGNYDVYKIPAAGGPEIRLTTAEGLDDGPEFSPDGKNIYFNSVRSGSMQIWKMNPDGSKQQQVTNDGFQNWFAHPSPDGNQLIMISYLPEVPASSHPRNERVMLRMMPAKGGIIRSLAYLYGGQGTINVPSWSPDSKKVAFVSYTY